MMYKPTNILRGRPWLVLLTLLVWLLPQRAAAERYVEKTYQYMVMLNGSNTIRIKAPVYDEKWDDHWVEEGYLKAKWKDDAGTQHDDVVLYWAKNESSHDNDKSELNTKFRTDVGGSIDITQGNSSNHFNITKSSNTTSCLIYENDGAGTYDFTAIWTLPYDMLGKSLELYWDVRIDYTRGTAGDQSYKLKDLSGATIDVPAAQTIMTPNLTMAMMSYSKPGMLEIPWVMSTSDLTALRYEYMDVNGKTVKQDMPTNTNSGVIYLNAIEPHKNFHLVVSYKDKDKNLIENVSSDVQEIPVIHAPHGLTARPLGGIKSMVEVKWNVGYPDEADFTTTDFFEVERSLTGKDADFENIGQVLFSPELAKDGVFTFIDSTVVNAIDARMLQDGGILGSVAYRVRRAMTTNWGWGINNNCANTTTCTLDKLHLMRIADYTAQWEDSVSHTARVAWQYADEPGAVWDDRARMVLRVNMKNRAGEIVDSMVYTLNKTEREQRYKVLTLSRPCVDFDIDLQVEKGQSPLTNDVSQLKDYYFPIRNAQDWTTFRDMVDAAEGKRAVNARLYTDIAETNVYIAWGTSVVYNGVFDGNGHTLTVRTAADERVMAPFRYVGNATIKNLHVAGTIKTSGQVVSGLIGTVMAGSTVTVENCHSSVTVGTTYSGESGNGGLIGRVNGANIVIRNSMFDGSFEGENSTHNAGFIGWIAPNSNVVIDNSLFTPDLISTKLVGCKTWARQDTSAEANITLSIRNSFASKAYEEGDKTMVIDGKTYMVLNNADDWHNFAVAVNEAKNTKEVNAILGSNITINGEYAGVDSGARFQGILDGNGYTITLNIDKNENYLALFRYARNYTIKNLHLKGTVKGKLNTGGLVGFSSITGSNRNYISNCRVSANITPNSDQSDEAGGFIGASDGSHTITNCLFDGSVMMRNFSSDAAAAFIGIQGTKNVDVMTNCLEKGEYRATFYGMNFYQQSGFPRVVGYCNGSSSSKNNWSYHEEKDDYFNGKDWGDVNHVGSMSVSKLVDTLDVNEWQEVGGQAVPKMRRIVITGEVYASQEAIDSINVSLLNGWTRVDGKLVPSMTTVNDFTYATFTKPTLDNFHHESLGKIDKELITQTRQSSVVLAWNTDGNPIDYFIVQRRLLGQGEDAWVTIATNITQMSYEDTSVSPLAVYEYKVLATSDCEGKNYTWTDTKRGECKHTGRVTGYVRFQDGTGVPDVKVNIDFKKNTVKYVYTDESGYFEADELSYRDTTTVTYEVSPVGEAIKMDVASYSVTFNAHSNDEEVHEFIVTNGKRFSGYVMYDGTSIPVKGANFKVNGKKIHNNRGDLVETDYDGSFSFRVLEGDNTIQAVMDKHVFTGDGWYKNSNKQNITSDVAGIYFYDATKVKLTGRIVGGDDQGRLPLGNNLSKNNLGDSLQMVLTLEGDNTSWLVYDNLNPSRTERDTVYLHKRHALHPEKVKPFQTLVQTRRKRMVVTPDVRTGEYELLLPPVRWKVQQVYCTGYPTLYQEGQASEVIDLTDCLDSRDTTYVGTYDDWNKNSVYEPTLTYNAIYNRIYHSPVEITYKQMGYDEFDYFGDKTYVATNLAGDRRDVPLAYMGPDSLARYTFGYPVFSLERKYYIQLKVSENYPYNNDAKSRTIDRVPVKGGTATMHNGLRGGMPTADDFQEIDSLGQAVFTVTANQVAKLLSREDALKTISFSVVCDSTHYESKPLQAYVLNMFPLAEGKDILADGQPLLFDILRDPPGAFSSNTLAKGATLNYAYTLNLSLSSGLAMSVTGGQQKETFFGTVAGAGGNAINATTTGYLSISDNATTTLTDLVFNMVGNKAWSYSMNIGENISTSGDPSMVGADADLYIGAVQNMVVAPMSTIRAVTDSMYNEISTRLAASDPDDDGVLSKYRQYGSLVEIAKGEIMGKDGKMQTFHLVRDMSLGYGPKLKSNFVYSQKQILEQIIPDKAKEALALMYIGTEADAQALANKTKRPVYLSLRSPDDPKFACINGETGEFYNTSIKEANDTINYLIVLPTGAKAGDFNDEVNEKAQIILAWMQMITQNEHEKLYASDHVVNYDIAGAQGVNHSETFASQYTHAEMLYFPWGKQPDYFTQTEKNGSWQAPVTLGASVISAVVASFVKASHDSKPTNGRSEWLENDTNGEKVSNIKFGGLLIKWSLVPVLSMSSNGTDSKTSAYTRTESFTIACDPQSRLNVDVYRVLSADTTTMQKNQHVEATDIYTNLNYNTLTDEVLARMKGRVIDVGSMAHGFVFRTRGGATQNPWEDQRKTLFYQKDTELDARTQKIVNPKIRLDKQSVSGVSVNDAARFTVYLSNESEKPEATGGLTPLQLFVLDQMNPQGAKISVNGQILTTGGMTVTVVPGTETALQMEVRAGQGFDYEGLTIGVMSPTDAEHTKELTTFDVHFLREAGAVNIAVPGDKWVLNTNAQKDGKRGWYIPVTINGFDRYQHNFDHIEFQYKESQRGDDSWTNLCSYYASDSLMAKANGVRDLIPENGNIVTQFYGEGWVTERSYDLRAVLCCRNGNDFLTTSSKVVSGIKDTRRPQLFGSPEPKSGLLYLNDDIVFNFSEDIEYNYLSAITNFEVKGEVNNDNLSEMVSVQFDGKGSVESEAKRNFNGKDLTIDLMIKPTETGRDMPLFSHGTNGQKLQLWLTKDFKLKAVVNKQTFTSDSVIGKNAFRQVALVINQKDSVLTFFKGGIEIGRDTLNALYHGTGPLIFGRTNDLDRSQSQYYEGRMMEARLWYSAMNGALIGTTYGNRRLTGYEKDLVDYYPMNEGSGTYVKDLTQGANAQMIEAGWAIPRGLSLKLEKSDKGMLLNNNALNRTSEQDYTLMFWFKTDAEGRGTLLSNGRGLKADDGGENQFHIGFEDSKLMYRSNGFAAEVPGTWSDDAWHHFAMTVNRSRNVANIYMDKELVTTFAADSLGGISGGYPLIGATRYDVVGDSAKVETFDAPDALKGHIDELMFFAQALPEQLISTYTTKSPNGDEAGLLTYLSFDRQERQKDNSIEVVPYVYSKKLYLDDKGQPRYQLDPQTKEPTNTLVRDYLFVDNADVVLQHIDAQHAAPVVPYEEVTNLKFGFIGKGNQLLVELDEPAAKLHRRNIYVTVRDIEDKNGNTMASPQTACYYVMNSSLEWLVNRLDFTIKYGAGEELDMPLINNSATTHTYTIENCPRWLTLNKYGDRIAPQALDAITATVSKDLSIGTYNEILYLTDEEGITEPFYLNLTVEGEQPDWANAVDGDLLRHSMSISGQVFVYDELDTDTRDIVGAFDDENVCHGFANISHDAQSGDNGLYLTVYDNQQSGRMLNFRLWQYNTGRELVLTPPDTIRFEDGAVLGTDTPVRFKASDSFVQYFDLAQGWNWVSFNLDSPQLDNVNELLNGMKWSEGDMLTDMTCDTTLVYKGGQWLATGSTYNMIVSPKKAYAIKVQENSKLPVGGTVIQEAPDRTILVKQGWNAIGYTPMSNLTVETALSDYYDNAEQGDVIKSHTEFAYFTKTGNTGRWRGSLQYMKPGEGYMLLRKGAKRVTFTYPFYDLYSNYREDWMAPAKVSVAPQMRSTMSLSAAVNGFSLEEGDRLVAYTDGELVGETYAVNAPTDVSGSLADNTDEPIYLTIGGDRRANIRFAIERDGRIVAASSNVITFHADDVLGTPDEPYAISFSTDPTSIRLVAGDDEQGKWHTVSGVQLPQRPTQKGLYIHNGRKVVVK